MITTRTHGILDYIIGVALIAAPWLFRFADDGPATWVPVVLGAGVILMSLLTRYELGVVGMIPMKTHLWVDMIAGVFLAASPWIFGFAGFVWVPHVVVGLLILGAGMATRSIPTTTDEAARHHHGRPLGHR